MNDADYLRERIAAVERRVRAAVGDRRVVDPTPDDPFRGLYFSPEAIDVVLDTPRLPFAVGGDPQLAMVEARADALERAGHELRLRSLARSAGLTALDVEILLIALAPDLDSRFEQLYGYLNDDVTRRRTSVGLSLRLCGLDEADPAGRFRLGPHGPLIRSDLIVLEDEDRPFLTRALRLLDRVVSHLLGDDRPDPAVSTVLDPVPPVVEVEPVGALGRMLVRGTTLVYLTERSGGNAAGIAASALAVAGRRALVVDSVRLMAEAEPALAARAVAREALLTGAGIVLGPTDSLGDRPDQVIRAAIVPNTPLLLSGSAGWDPRWSNEPPLLMEAPPLPRDDRGTYWRQVLNGQLADGVDPVEATAHFRLAPTQIIRAATAAVQQAHLDAEPVNVKHLRQGARSANAAGLERLARRIEPGVTWHDLVLPKNTLSALKELAARARLRDRVLDEWKMRPGGGRGRGVSGLFAGDSGTGKTLSAEVIASDLGLDLYSVNLATVVDKYIGETEKNLERIFTEASRVNAVLLFDEADAIFGKRSEVRDAHDRYANVESAYLLQRMESFDGLAILTTNLRANVDDAFTRRLDTIVDFPMPDAVGRKALWDRCLGDNLPRADDLDLEFMAESFELAGGNIRTAALTAAYMAADAGRPATMEDLVTAVASEYRKLGRLTLDREFGPYATAISRRVW